jgi:hypothetical protein
VLTNYPEILLFSDGTDYWVAGIHATATTVLSGLVELETVAETVAGNGTTRAVTGAGLAAYVLQPVSNVQAAGYALAAVDIGNVVFASGAGAQAFTLPDLSGSLTAGRALLLTIVQVNAATLVTITPGGTSQINNAGVGVAYVSTAGATISLLSRDGLAWVAR